MNQLLRADTKVGLGPEFQTNKQDSVYTQMKTGRSTIRLSIFRNPFLIVWKSLNRNKCVNNNIFSSRINVAGYSDTKGFEFFSRIILIKIVFKW